MGNLVRLLVARLWSYKEPHHIKLVAKERKEGTKGNKKAHSGGNKETKDRPNILSMVRGI